MVERELPGAPISGFDAQIAWVLETFLHARVCFASPADFDAQFTDWSAIANARIVRTLMTRPVDRLDADRAAMLPLPPFAPSTGWVNRVRLRP